MAQFWKTSLLLIATIGFTTGCSTFNKSTWAGAGSGAAIGGIAGSLVPGDSSSKPKNILIGSAAGATLGALSGALIHKSMEDRERTAFEKGKQSNSGFGQGTLVSSGRGSSNRRYIPPKIERRWVDDEISGNTLVEGHYEQVIVEEGRWE